MSNTAGLNKKLDDAILSGKAMEAFEEFYADDVVMQENTDAPTLGKGANREREIQFFSSIEQFHSAQLLGAAASGDISFSEVEMVVTFKGGAKVTMTQVARRQWKDGKVVNERFYYNKG